MKSLLLSCEKLSDSHTSENLASVLKKITDKFSVTNKVLIGISDNAPNIVNAIKLLGWKHFPCYAHTLNLVVQDGLEEQ